MGDRDCVNLLFDTDDIGRAAFFAEDLLAVALDLDAPTPLDVILFFGPGEGDLPFLADSRAAFKLLVRFGDGELSD